MSLTTDPTDPRLGRPGAGFKESSVIMTEDNLTEVAALLVDAPPVVIPKEPKP